MHCSGVLLLLILTMLGIGCGETKKALSDSATASRDNAAVNEAPKETPPLDEPPLEEIPDTLAAVVPLPPFPLPAYLPTYGGGGGKFRGEKSRSPACSDGVKNQDETGVDCGGTECNACTNSNPCEQSSDCSSGLCENKVCSPCEQNSDCSNGLCGNGICGSCEQDSDCSNGLCGDGVCGSCTGDSDCSNGLCVDEVCGGCAQDSDCSNGLCENEVCGSCQQDSDCSSGFCENGVCSPCSDGSDCPSGFCENGVCTPCDQNSDCLSDSCVNGVCTPCTIGQVRQCGTTDEGACEFGTQTCLAGAFGPCMGEIGPAPETCNGADDNCDGTTDEICVLRAFITSTLVSDDLVSSANGLDPMDVIDLPTAYNCSADEYTDGGIAYVSDNGTSGVNAADCLCRAAAATQVDELRCEDNTFSCWKAWIADANLASAPAFRFFMAQAGGSSVPIYQVNASGAADLNFPIATGGWDDLIVCGGAGEGAGICLDDPMINSGWIDEDGVRQGITGTGFNPSNVTESGTQEDTINHCSNWSELTNFIVNPPAPLGSFGADADRTASWTDEPVVVNCTPNNRLYCFEDITP